MKYAWIIFLTSAVAITGCGKKNNSAGGPPPMDMPVSAILAKATSEPVRETVQIVGSLTARDAITIVSELDSTVTAIGAKEGQQVKKGDVLFRLEDVATASLLADAEAAHTLAELSHKRNADLIKNNTISQQKYDEGEADLKSKKARLDLARHDHEKTVITSPFPGTAGEKSISVGQFVNRGQRLMDVVRTDPLDIVGGVPERYAAALSNGLHVEFTTDAYADKAFKASIWYVSPTLDSASRTVRIKAEVPNSEGLLKPGMFGNMAVILEERSDSLIIPEACIQMQGSAMTVVRVNKAGRSEFAPVKTGKRSKGRIEILSGLNAGDLVVVEGWQKMGPGSLVMSAPESEAYGVAPGPVAEAENDNL